MPRRSRAAEAVVAPEPEQAKWRENRWNRRPHYECAECKFDTLHLPAMIAHAKSHEPPPAPPEEEADDQSEAEDQSAPSQDADAPAPETTES